jgi:hypothetical protein
MLTNPEGSGLGSALLMIAAFEGLEQNANRIEALSTAKDAVLFYLKSGFLPNNPVDDGAEAYDIASIDGRAKFAMRLLGKYNSGTWEGNTQTILGALSSKIAGIWEIEFA